MLKPSYLRLLGKYLLLAVMIPLLGIPPFQSRTQVEIQQAQEALRYGSFQEAAGHMAAAAERQPWRAELWEAAGSYALQGGEPGKSAAYLQQAAGLKISSGGLADLGKAYELQGDLPLAIQAWEQSVQTGAAPQEVYTRLTAVYLEQRNFRAAIRLLKMLSERDPHQAQVQYRLGLLTATQAPESALAYLSQAAQLDPGLKESAAKISQSITAARITEDPAYALVSAGRALAGLEEWDLAAEAFHQATLQRPDFADAWAFLGEARQHGAVHEAESSQTGLQELQKAIALDPDSQSAYLFLALYWQRQADPARAVLALETALERDPESPLLLAEMGNALATKGDLAAASQAYQQAAELAPYDAAYARLLGSFALKYNYEVRSLGLPAARRAVKLNAEDPASLVLMAQVLIKLNDQYNAGRFLGRALQADSNYAPAHLYQGLLHLLQGRGRQALQELELARALDPASPAAEQAERLMQDHFP